MGRGRPTRSNIRQNIVEILYILGKAYGYEIYNRYIEIFPKVTMRSIYYHLKKGVDLGEFIISKIEREKGNYSWGDTAEKIYYSLGSAAKPSMQKRVRDHLKNHGKK